MFPTDVTTEPIFASYIVTFCLVCHILYFDYRINVSSDGFFSFCNKNSDILYITLIIKLYANELHVIDRSGNI